MIKVVEAMDFYVETRIGGYRKRRVYTRSGSFSNEYDAKVWDVHSFCDMSTTG